MKKVFIGVGHGGRDKGACANGLKESYVNLTMALELKKELERAGVIVGISRTNDVTEYVNQRINEANAFRPDLALDIHNNAGGGDGFEVYRQTNSYSRNSIALAKNLESEVIKIGQNSRGVKTRLLSSGQDYFAFLRNVKAPTVLVEGAFLDTSDYRAIDTISEQKAFGRAYAKAVLKTLGIKEKPVSPLKTIYRVQVGAFSVKNNADSYLAKIKAAGFKDAFLTKVNL